MRKPAHLELAGGKSPRQRIWEAMRALKHFNLPQLAQRSKVDKGTLRTYVRSLEKAHYVQKRRACLHESGFYELIKDTGVDAPRLDSAGNEVTQGRSQQQMWRAMRIQRGTSFSYIELAALASTEDVQVPRITAQQYIKHLLRAGYLSKVQEETRGKHPAPARYVLYPSQNTGPRAPMVQRTKCVYDPNLGKIVWNEEIDA
jgi:predicted transcriptional regulator